MFFLFSGEGATDLGVCSNGALQCDGKDYAYGPMAVIVSQIVKRKHRYTLLDTEHFGFVSEGALANGATELKAAKKAMKLPGLRRPKETMHFFNNARVLARIAQEKEKELDDKVVAVLFRDKDGAASAGRALWSNKWKSMLAGFEMEGFTRGVPMVPNPKSEAWVLCAVKNQYQGCQVLEEKSPGSDHSPNSLKGELKKHLGKLPSREELCQMVEDGAIDVQRIQMRSFDKFKSRLEEVI